jgi:neutral ceramidase
VWVKRTLPGTWNLPTKDDDGTEVGEASRKLTSNRPVVELNMMGYADLAQTDTGLRQRIYSRAFIVGSPDDEASRFIYLVLDTQSGDIAVRNGILEGVAALGDDYAMYTTDNIAVTGTHSHSGPGAWLNYLLPQVTSKGFDKQSYQAIVDGAVLSIKRAHESLTEGRLTSSVVHVDDANINRSLYAYLANPEAERAKYDDNVDKNLTMLKFTRESDGKAMGVLTWFAVHGTSLLGNNTLIAGDNKGVSAYLFEKAVQGTTNAADDFVAGFSQANVGDTTPNVDGAYCEDGSGQECRLEDSTCGGTSQACHGRGPFWGLDDGGTKSCWEIGNRVFNGAINLYNDMQDSTDSNSVSISGSVVKAYHTFKDFSSFSFTLTNGSVADTCAAALGYSFAAGTSDWPGAFDFKQNDSGDPDANPLWSVVSAFLHEPDAEQKACQSPKPILIDAGEIHEPYDWAPNIVDIQMLRAGNFFIIVSPGEATTMSGRRWREAIAEEVSASGMTDSDPVVVLGGPANSYTHYIATPEEYGVQRYEGASTLFGPHTLDAYINLTVSYLPYLTEGGGKPDAGPTPPDNRDNSLSFITGVVYDNPPLGKNFGDVVTDVNDSYSIGDVINATFVGANPRNNLRQEDTYAAVEMQDSDGEWTQILSDDDWELVFYWERTNSLTGTSEVTVSWETNWSGRTPSDGTYRLHYYGDSKAPITGKISSFDSTSGTFTLS